MLTFSMFYPHFSFKYINCRLFNKHKNNIVRWWRLLVQGSIVIRGSFTEYLSAHFLSHYSE